jgi:single-strand DNA-binding protein
VGRLKQDRWTGTDGKNHAKVAIVAEHVEYRPDFRKNSEPSDTESGEREAAMDGGHGAFPAVTAENEVFEEIEALTF